MEIYPSDSGYGKNHTGQEECRYCERAQVVPVVDKNIEKAPTPGNKYRRFCLSCKRWLPMCSKTYFKQHLHPHVLPVGDSPTEDQIIPIEEYDYGEEIATLQATRTDAEPERNESKSAPTGKEIAEERITVDGDRNDQGSNETFETWTALQKSTDKIRANLIADLVGHPKGAPSIQELDHRNPILGEDTIRRQLNALQEADVVEVLVLESDDRISELPHRFYQLTTEARELFDQNGIFPEGPWKRQYRRIEKPDKIKEIEEISRPAKR